MSRILSVSDYEEIKEYLTEINNHMVEFQNDIDNAINVFETNEVVQEFYASGKYGTGIKERLQKVKDVVAEYMTAISSGDASLVVQTQKYVSEQLNLLMSVPSSGDIISRLEGNN